MKEMKLKIVKTTLIVLLAMAGVVLIYMLETVLDGILTLINKSYKEENRLSLRMLPAKIQY